MSASSVDADANFVHNMKAAREARSWTQAVLAEQLVTWHNLDGMSQSAISRIEKGDREVRLGEARAIASAFGTTVDALSGPPERFAHILEWNRLAGEFVSAEPALRIAAAVYEDARRALATYLENPKVGLTRAKEESMRAQVERDAVEVVAEILEKYRTEPGYSADSEPPF